jgi:hypothetical protein
MKEAPASKPPKYGSLRRVNFGQVWDDGLAHLIHYARSGFDCHTLNSYPHSRYRVARVPSYRHPVFTAGSSYSKTGMSPSFRLGSDLKIAGPWPTLSGSNPRKACNEQKSSSVKTNRRRKFSHFLWYSFATDGPRREDWGMTNDDALPLQP